jgi:hypothetical protein
MVRLLLFTLNLLFCLTPVFSQIENIQEKGEESARIEINASSDKESYRTVTCGKTGVLLFFKSTEIADAQRVKWYFSFYDTNLRQAWVKSLPVLSDLDFRFKTFSGDTLCLVFGYTGKVKSEDQPFEIIRIEPREGTFIPNITKIPANTEPAFFQISGHSAYIALNQKNGQALIEILDLKSNHTKGFLISQQSHVIIRWFGIDTSAHTLKMIVTRVLGKKQSDNVYQVFDTTGNLKAEVQLGTGNEEKELAGFRVVTTEKGEDLITGTYRLTKGGSSQKNKEPDESSGLFTSLLVPGSQKNINYFNFINLKSIGILLSAKDLAELKKKAQKKNKNADEFSADLYVVNHDPFIHDRQIIQISELYNLQYHVENFTDFDFYGRPYTNSYSVFDGFRFSGAFITGFNQEGQLLWDNAMEIKDLMSSDLSSKVVSKYVGDEMLLAYYSGGKIGSKIIMKDEVRGKLGFDPVEMRYPDDKLVAETRSSFLPWYDNYFLCCGFQEIKNIALESNNKRLVFQLTKVKFGE